MKRLISKDDREALSDVSAPNGWLHKIKKRFAIKGNWG